MRLSRSELDDLLLNIAREDSQLAATIRREIDSRLYITHDRTRVAMFFGKSLDTIDQWLKKGMPYVSKGRGARGEYDLRECAQWLANERSVATPQSDEQKQLDIETQKEKLELLKLEHKRKKAELIDYDEVQVIVMSASASIKKGIAQWHHTWGNDCAEQLNAIIDEAVASLSDYVARYRQESDGPEDV